MTRANSSPQLHFTLQRRSDICQFHSILSQSTWDSPALSRKIRIHFAGRDNSNNTHAPQTISLSPLRLADSLKLPRFSHVVVTCTSSPSPSSAAAVGEGEPHAAATATRARSTCAARVRGLLEIALKLVSSLFYSNIN